MPSHVPLQVPSGVVIPQTPLQLPMQMPSQAPPGDKSHGPTQVPGQGQPFEQSMPTGPVLLPSAVPAAVDALLVLLAPGPPLVPVPVSMTVVEPASAESSFASSPQATASSNPASSEGNGKG